MELDDQDVAWAKESLKKTGLFDTCSDVEWEQLINGVDKKFYTRGSTILFQGEISSMLYLVQSGKVSVYVRKYKDKIKIAELGPNSFFGEISLLTPRAATATVKAEEDSQIFFLPADVVQPIVNNNPVLAEIINKKITERLEDQKQKSESQ